MPARRFFTVDEFAQALARNNAKPDGVVCRFAEIDQAAAAAATERTIPYVLSTGAVARDGHTVNQDGWQLDAYKANPVVCWAHDTSEPPIGRMTQIGVVGGQLRGVVEYPDRDTYAFGDTIYRLVKGRFLNAVSVSWDAIKWKHSTDRARPNGIDFLEQELMEVSQVPLPADTNAIALARAAGIDTGPVFAWAERVLDLGNFVGISRPELEQLRRDAKMPRHNRATSNDWKAGGARGLPLNTEKSWDGPAAEARIFADAGFDGDSPDGEKAARAFLFHDAANPSLKSSYKEPFADIIDGKLTAVKAGLDAAASRLSATDVPDDLKTEAQALLDSYKADDSGARAALAGLPLAPRRGRRDLYDVIWTIEVASQLAYIQEMIECEAAWEGDNSPLPARLKLILESLLVLTKDMLAEEAGELLGGDAVIVYDIGPGDDVPTRIAKVFRSMIVGTLRQASEPLRARQAARAVKGADARSLALLLKRGMLNATGQAALANMVLARAGKVLSSDNEATLRTAHEHMRSAAECVRGVVAQNYDEPDPDDDEVGGNNEPDIDELDAITQMPENREAREKRARRLKLLEARTPALQAS